MTISFSTSKVGAAAKPDLDEVKGLISLSVKRGKLCCIFADVGYDSEGSDQLVRESITSCSIFLAKTLTSR
jgi:hypothetical protein